MQPTADRFCVNCGAASPPSILSLEGFCQVCTLHLSDEAAREAWQRATPAERGRPTQPDPDDARGAAVVARGLDVARAQQERLAWFLLGLKAGLALAARAGLPVVREALGASVPVLLRLLSRWGIATPPPELIGTTFLTGARPMSPDEAHAWERRFDNALAGKGAPREERPMMVTSMTPHDQALHAIVRQVTQAKGEPMLYQAHATICDCAGEVWN